MQSGTMCNLAQQMQVHAQPLITHAVSVTPILMLQAVGHVTTLNVTGEPFTKFLQSSKHALP